MTYNDNEMLQRKLFVSNIPYLRGLSNYIIIQVIQLIKEDVFEQGQTVLSSNSANDNILILYQGTLQARIERTDP